MNDAEKKFVQTLEEGIGSLSQEDREKVFRSCAINCVKDYVLTEQRRKFEECNGDMDLMYSNYPDNEYCFTRIIEKGHIYEMGYPRCLCYMYESGFVKSDVYCECSRQSVIYVLKELFPNKAIEVETVQTVLGGADQCVFRITVA